MANLTAYFERQAYTPEYFLGDRVFGHWNKIPFVGSVGNDTVISLEEGPRITITLDLPIFYENSWRYCIVTKHKFIKRLKSFD